MLCEMVVVDFLYGVEACLGVREDAVPFIIFIFVQYDRDGN